MTIKVFDSALEHFIESLEKSTFAKVIRMLNLLEQFGNRLGMPHSKKIAIDLFELRVRGHHEVRILYTFHAGIVVLLHGFIKKSQRIPERELHIARQKLTTLDRV